MRSAHRLNLSAIIAAAVLLAVMASCASTKHVPQGKLLLDRVRIDVEDPSKQVNTKDLYNYLRQNENHRVLGGLKLQLAIYNISGRDSSNWFNRWIQRVGTPPVIYDSALTVASAHQLHMALNNRGFMKNEVSFDVKADSAKRKARVDYHVKLNEPYTIRSISYNIPDDTLRHIILADTTGFPVQVGALLDHNKLDAWRQAITDQLRNEGYYAFNKDYITFTADTAAGSRAVDLTLNSMAPYHSDRMPYYTRHMPF